MIHSWDLCVRRVVLSSPASVDEQKLATFQTAQTPFASTPFLQQSQHRLCFPGTDPLSAHHSFHVFHYICDLTHTHTHALGHYDIMQFLNDRTTRIPSQESLLTRFPFCLNKTHGKGQNSSNRNKNTTAHVTKYHHFQEHTPHCSGSTRLGNEWKIKQIPAFIRERGRYHTYHIILLEEETPACQENCKTPFPINASLTSLNTTLKKIQSERMSGHKIHLRLGAYN